MLRNTIRSRASVNAVKAVRRSFSTGDWEGLHGYTGDTKLPFTAWQPGPELKSPSKQAAAKPAQPTQVANDINKVPARKNSVEAKDEELRLKLEGISGEGGEAGVELEDGKTVGLKRGVKENMFRII